MMRNQTFSTTNALQMQAQTCLVTNGHQHTTEPRYVSLDQQELRMISDDTIVSNCTSSEQQLQQQTTSPYRLTHIPVRMHLSFTNCPMSVREVTLRLPIDSMTEQYLDVFCKFESDDTKIDVSLRLPIVLIWIAMESAKHRPQFYLDIYLNLHSSLIRDSLERDSIQCFVAGKERTDSQFIHHEAVTSGNCNVYQKTSGDIAVRICMLNQRLPLVRLDTSNIENELCDILSNCKSLSADSSN
ncbi:hypothetical protein C9374_004484 [Naegleria lovaniensis]|uniref:Uncharacterized protein n=1 Tax=Naegleria lovaniensis TaxID=51637 RepID=A0AA88KJF2_NAELO|nr:uncharacterized protein C9374_004484 [Naegleria lovaniensis]KAG2383147.1 hypothetical protein C9374_004484 [Naegleria lovaniensis]